MQNPSSFLCRMTPKLEPFYFNITDTMTECSHPVFFSIFSFSILQAHTSLKQVVWFHLATLFKSNHGVGITPVTQCLSYPTEYYNTVLSLSLQRTSYSPSAWHPEHLLVVVINLCLTTYNICPIPFSYQQNLFLRTSSKLWLEYHVPIWFMS